MKNVKEQIKEYIYSLPEPKCSEMQALHKLILHPPCRAKCKLWFLDGKDEKGKVVSNPNIGYGTQTLKYKDGTSREFYQIGLSANTAGISVYIMGLADKTYLRKNYADKLGKASVTGYCIKFKSLNDINIDILESAIRFGLESADEKNDRVKD